MPDRDDLRTVAPLGLALGGGGALGAAHVGVLQVLVERGIQPSIVVGTSIGSVIGAAYAMGVDPYRLERMVTRAKWGTFAKRGTGVGFGALDTEGLRRTVESMSGDLLIEDLPCRYGAVATDVLTRKAVTLESGSL